MPFLEAAIPFLILCAVFLCAVAVYEANAN